MKYYDITQELFTSNVYPGDKAPMYRRISDMADGKVCNITELEIAEAHNSNIMSIRPYNSFGIEPSIAAEP